MIPRRGIANGVLQAPFNVKSLFAKGEQGVWYDPSDLSTLFQDKSGTTPVTAVGQPVGLMLDKSRGLVSSGTELVTNGGFTSGTSNWTNNGGLATTFEVVAHDGVNNALHIVGTSQSSGALQPSVMSAGSVYVVTYKIKVVVGQAYLGISQAAIGGLRTTANSGVWTTVSVAFYGAIDTTLRVYTNTSNAEFYVSDISIKLVLGNHATQATAASRPILQQDAGGRFYLSCDGVDDGMATASIDFTPTDKMTVCAGVRKLSDAAQGVLVELSANASSNAGSFNVSAPSTAAANYSIRGGGTTSQTNTITTYTAPISNVITGVLDIGNDILTARVNGVNAGTVASDQGTGNFGNYPLYLFRRGGTTLPFNGNFYGLVIHGTQSTPKQISQIEKYLAAKAGVAI